MDIFLTLLPVDVWDALVAEQPSSEEWHIVIWYGSRLILEVSFMTWGLSAPLDSVCRIVYMFKLAHYFKAVYRLLQSPSATCLSIFKPYPTLSESEVQQWLSVRFLTFHLFHQRSCLTQANMSTGPDLTMINKHIKFSTRNQFRL